MRYRIIRALRTTAARAASRARVFARMLSGVVARYSIRIWGIGRRVLEKRLGRRLTLSTILFGTAAVAVTSVLPTAGIPPEEPPVFAAAIPATSPHRSSDGYDTTLYLTVRSCDAPVEGRAVISVLPKFFKSEDGAGATGSIPRHVLFPVAFSDPNVRVSYVILDDWRYTARHVQRASWVYTLPDRRLPYFRDYPAARVAVLRIDDWSSRTAVPVEVGFTAHWLRRRAYHSCWLSLPDLAGSSSHEDFGYKVAESATRLLGARSGAQPVDTSTGRSSVHGVRVLPSGQLEHYSERQSYGPSYATSITPPSVGNIRVLTKLSVVPGVSADSPQADSPPTWSCAGHAQLDYLPVSGHDPDTDLNDADHGCRGWVALAEPDASSGRDLWLLAIGALLSLAVALLAEAVLTSYRGVSASS